MKKPNASFFGKALMVSAVALMTAACQVENWDGDNDGAKDDLGYWWPNAGSTVSLACLSVPGKNVAMTRRDNPAVTTDGNKIYLNHLYNVNSRLSAAGCYEKGKFISSSVKTTLFGLEFTNKYEKKARFRFQDGNNVLYIFSKSEQDCFNDTNQAPDLMQRAIDCNVDTANDQAGLTYNIGTIDEIKFVPFN